MGGLDRHRPGLEVDGGIVAVDVVGALPHGDAVGPVLLAGADVIGAGNVRVNVVVVNGEGATKDPAMRMPAPGEFGSAVTAVLLV